MSPPPRTDTGYHLLKEAITQKVPCDFVSRRGRTIRGIPIEFDDTTAKLYVRERLGDKDSVTEILRGDISAITYPESVLKELPNFKAMEPEVKKKLSEQPQRKARGGPHSEDPAAFKAD